MMFGRKKVEALKQEIIGDPVSLSIEALNHAVDTAASMDALINLLSQKNLITSEEFIEMKKKILDTPTYTSVKETLKALESVQHEDHEMVVSLLEDQKVIEELTAILDKVSSLGEVDEEEQEKP